MEWSKEQRFILRVSAGLALVIAVLWIVVVFAGESLVREIYDGNGIWSRLKYHAETLLYQLPREQHRQALLGEMYKIAGRLTTVYLVCQSIVLFASLRNRTLFRDFFSAEAHPLNLAILRVMFFLTLLPRIEIGSIIAQSQLPAQMRVAPPGLSWLVANLIESESVLNGCYAVFVIACAAGLVGLWTRTACVTATVLAFYLIGVTQFFGKINHLHHIIWIGALLAASRCSDVLSLDAIWRSWRGKVPITPPKPENVYAVPLRFVWLFLGVIYFFPGFWKYVVSGPEWFLSDNLRYRILLRMFASEDWSPLFRIDQFPTLCKIGGLTTIVMEMAFIFLVFSRWGKYVAAAGGLLFHGLVRLFLNISFWPIQAYYVAFFDWHRILRRIGAWCIPERQIVDFDPANTTANRLVAAAQTVDLFGTVDFQPDTSPRSDNELGLAIKDATGFSAFKVLTWRIPLLWICLPLLLKGRLIPITTRPDKRSNSLRFVYAVGTIVLIANSLCGFMMIDSWPFGLYPTFARLAEPTFQSLSMEPVNPAGAVIDEVDIYFDPAIREVYPQDRLAEVLHTFLEPTPNRTEKLVSLWNIWRRKHPQVGEVAKVNFYATTYSVFPEEAAKDPLQRRLMGTLTLGDGERRTRQSPIPDSPR